MDVPRAEFFSITLNNKDIDCGRDSDDRDNNYPINFNGPFRIFISDNKRVHEFYDPIKVNEFFTSLPLPEQSLLQKKSDDNTQNNFCDYDDEEEEEELQDDTVLVMTGPDGDIVPWDVFDVIVHYDTGDREIDDSRLTQLFLPLYEGEANPLDVVRTWWCRGRTECYNRRVIFQVRGQFGSLTLDFIVYNDSRLVTLDVKWLLEDGIVDGVGGDGKIKDATTTTTTESSSYICGELSFHNSEYDDATSVLLETPEDKAVKVAHGESIRLLKSKVAIPVCEFFTVEATLHDPITNSVVKGPVTFGFDIFSEENSYPGAEEPLGSPRL